ncbi:hypothetical protein D3C86_1712330 [compost metagenome]
MKAKLLEAADHVIDELEKGILNIPGFSPDLVGMSSRQKIQAGCEQNNRNRDQQAEQINRA